MGLRIETQMLGGFFSQHLLYQDVTIIAQLKYNDTPVTKPRNGAVELIWPITPITSPILLFQTGHPKNRTSIIIFGKP